MAALFISDLHIDASRPAITDQFLGFLAAEAIAYFESGEWQLGELQAGMAELDSRQEISHQKVSRWLKSWGKPSETKAPK